MTPKIIVVVGPTASGKSALAVRLARQFNGEVISADSRQVYRSLDVGSGKVKRDETKSSKLKAKSYLHQGIPHHLLDVASPKRTFTVARYKKLAEQATRDIARRGRLPIFCGGTGFYLDAVFGQMAIPPVPPDRQLRARLEKLDGEKLFEKLEILDSARAKKIDRHNRRRLIRAIEVAAALGHNVKGDPWNLIKGRPLDCLKIGLKMPGEKLKEQIKKRLHERVRRGLIAEVKKLRQQGLSWQRLDNFGLDYRYASRYLRGLLTKQEMIRQLQTAIWHYAKRQMTWFRRDRDIHWVENNLEAERLTRDFLRK
ncbi:MAG: tRNA (adenosine(37)-N6)-dimethylallyltransferase MiaA [Candidatus Vogelbacteria bacterium]|nr:tRNA (adenosine(37)-N6)-dimethylallyltransferase MiaA [Candidatus Vogelbacteria bacterium]